MKKNISRRTFVASALTGAAISSLRTGLRSFAHDLRPPSDVPGAATDLEVPLANSPSWQEQGILNLAKSPYAKLHSVPVRAVTIGPGFLTDRRMANVNHSIPTMHDELESHGRMNNFRRLVGQSDAPQIGKFYSDSDVYKWTEAASFAMQSEELPQLRSTVSDIIDLVCSVQKPNGYLNTYYVGDRAVQSMTPVAQETGHELYNIGHMLQGAFANYRATGDRRLLDAGIRFVNDFLMPDYGPAPKQPIISGHPEIEMALVELYRLTGDKRHLDLAGYILQGDSRIIVPTLMSTYLFSGTPFTARTRVEGHAVRCMYACCGATDYYLETGDAAYWKTLNALWDDMTSSKMYVTGGIGAHAQGESFGDAYDLPNASAYAETCAAVGNFMWNWRMLAASGDAKFTDVLERALYNGINSGMSLDGTLYCYRNPLAYDPASGVQIRNAWYDTTCCPPNVERTFASLPGYFYSTSSDGIYLHLLGNSELRWRLEDGTPLGVTQKTNYPWDGDVEISISPATPAEFTFFLRIPAWTRKATVSVNGAMLDGVQSGAYLPVRRRWSSGDVVRLQLDMTPQVLQANPYVAEDLGRVAIQRGPLVYCLEQLDQPNGAAIGDLSLALAASGDASFETEFRSDLLGGVVVLHHSGVSLEPSGADGTIYPRNSSGPLYAPYQAQARANNKGGASLTFIPYYAWANRQRSAMEVWTPVTQV
jgi:DUF1680 family protein